MTHVEVGPVEDFTPGDRVIVSTKRGDIGVFNVNGDYYALLNTCAHQSGPICTGDILPKLRAEHVSLGRRVEEHFTDEQVIKCPWHGWEYDIESGDLVGGNASLPSFDVIVEDGIVYVDV